MSATSTTSPVSPPYYVAICIDGADAITDVQAKRFKNTLENFINAQVNANFDGKKLLFKSYGLAAEGYIVVNAANEEAVNWLLTTPKKVHFIRDFNRSGTQYEIDIKVMRLKRQISVTIDADTTYNDKTFKCLNQHFKHLKIDEWELMVKKGNRLIFNIPEDVAAHVDKTVELYFGFSMIGPTLEHLPTH